MYGTCRPVIVSLKPGTRASRHKLSSAQGTTASIQQRGAVQKQCKSAALTPQIADSKLQKPSAEPAAPSGVCWQCAPTQPGCGTFLDPPVALPLIEREILLCASITEACTLPLAVGFSNCCALQSNCCAQQRDDVFRAPPVRAIGFDIRVPLSGQPLKCSYESEIAQALVATSAHGGWLTLERQQSC